MTSCPAFPSSVDGPDLASESPLLVGALCANPVGPMCGPLHCVQSSFYKTQTWNILISFNRAGSPTNKTRNSHAYERLSVLIPISTFLLAPAAKTAWFWVSIRWQLISDWNSSGQRSQSPGNFFPGTARLAVAPKTGKWRSYTQTRRRFLNSMYFAILWRPAGLCNKLLILISVSFRRICSDRVQHIWNMQSQSFTNKVIWVNSFMYSFSFESFYVARLRFNLPIQLFCFAKDPLQKIQNVDFMLSKWQRHNFSHMICWLSVLFVGTKLESLELILQLPPYIRIKIALLVDGVKRFTIGYIIIKYRSWPGYKIIKYKSNIQNINHGYRISHLVDLTMCTMHMIAVTE